jgi:hypothetical protein
MGVRKLLAVGWSRGDLLEMLKCDAGAADRDLTRDTNRDRRKFTGSKL